MMTAAVPLLLAAALGGSPASALDGPWMGSAQIGGETVLLMMHVETKGDTAAAVLLLPLESGEFPGTLTPDGSRLRFMAPRDSVVLEGALDRGSFAGTIRRRRASGSFALHRALPPEATTACEGFYRSASRAFVHVQRWQELGGQPVMLNEAGELRALFALDDSTFVAGPAALQTRPVESTLAFARRGGDALSLQVRRGDSTRTFARTRAWEPREVRFRNGDVTLAGTLYVPAGPGPHPAIVLTHGSGDQDRSEGLLFMVPLLERGVAVLAYDKRGVGGSSGSWMDSGFDALAGDAIAAVELLKTRPEIDATRIGIWGLSQGGWVAPLAASRSKDVAFVIVVSAPAVTPEAQELSRMRHELAVDGEPEADIQLAQDLYRALNRWARTGQGWDAYVALRERAVGRRWGPPAGPPKPDNPYYTFWRLVLDHDPLPVLRGLACPVLAVYGGLDPNVRAVDNAPLMEEALRAAGNPASRVIVYPAGNHVMLEAVTGSGREMGSLGRFVPGYFETVAAWTLERAARPR